MGLKMNALSKLLIPIALGAAAAAVNFYSLQTSLKPVDFVAAAGPISQGQVITEKDLVASDAPVRLKDAMKVAAPLYDDRLVLVGQRARRDFAAGDLIFFKDTELSNVTAEVDFRAHNEAAMTVRLGQNTELASKFRVGMPVYFRIMVPRGNEQFESQRIGPFRLVAVGPEKQSGLLSTGETRPISQVSVAITLVEPPPAAQIALEEFLDQHQKGVVEDPRIYPATQ